MIGRSNKRFTLLCVYEETHPQAKPADIIIHDSCANEKITRNGRQSFHKVTSGNFSYKTLGNWSLRDLTWELY